jgi:hypothetical protein
MDESVTTFSEAIQEILKMSTQLWYWLFAGMILAVMLLVLVNYYPGA